MVLPVLIERFNIPQDEYPRLPAVDRRKAHDTDI
jgi:hypothetical protein